MFSLVKSTATLANVNMRSEQHGDAGVLASDIKLEIVGLNTILDAIEPGLMAAIYRKAEPGDEDQGSLDLSGDHLSKLRFPHLQQPLKSGRELTGYTFVMHYGIDEASDIKLSGVKVDGFVFNCQDGGTVKTTFRVIAHPEADRDISLLCKHISQKIEFSLLPPDADYGDGGAQ